MEKQVIITTSWDDGHKSDLRLALLLKKYGIAGTFYISPKNREFNANDLLSDQNILKISRDFEIGAHTLTHPRLTQVDEKEAFKEIIQSGYYLENLLNKKIKSFCFPGGKYNNRIMEIVKNAGFSLARTDDLMITNPGPGKEFFKLGTTVEVLRLTTRRVLGLLKYSIKNNVKLIPSLTSKDWEKIAMSIFNYIKKHGGVYHLRGHSWVLDKYNEWNKLERFLKYLNGEKNIKYVTNAEIIDIIK